MKIIRTEKYTKLAQVPINDSPYAPSEKIPQEQLNGLGETSPGNEDLPVQPFIGEGKNSQEIDWATLNNIKQVDRILQNIQLGSGEAKAGANGVRNAIGSIVPNPLIEEDAKRRFIADIEMAYSNLNKILTEADEYFQNKK